MKNFKDKKKMPLKFYITIFFMVISIGVAIYSAVKFIADWHIYVDSANKYSRLKKLYEETEIGLEVAQATEVNNNDNDKKTLSEINSNYIGWIKMQGVNVDYPIVQCRDNKTYLNQDFEGEYNSLGAIFMDYRCTEKFLSPHAIIYGHKANNGTMFGTLHKLSDNNFLKNHEYIIITTQNKEKLVYKIFSVRKSNIHDPAYQVDFQDEKEFVNFANSLNAPDNTRNILTLSTCCGSGNKADRFLVHAALTLE